MKILKTSTENIAINFPFSLSLSEFSNVTNTVEYAEKEKSTCKTCQCNMILK